MVHSDWVHWPHQQPDDYDGNGIADKGWHEPYDKLEPTERLVIKFLLHERYAPYSAYSVDKQHQTFANL